MNLIILHENIIGALYSGNERSNIHVDLDRRITIFFNELSPKKKKPKKQKTKQNKQKNTRPAQTV